MSCAKGPCFTFKKSQIQYKKNPNCKNAPAKKTPISKGPAIEIALDWPTGGGHA
jgi:hypothetical protein